MFVFLVKNLQCCILYLIKHFEQSGRTLPHLPPPSLNFNPGEDIFHLAARKFIPSAVFLSFKMCVFSLIGES